MMKSVDNKPLNHASFDNDFVKDHYRTLLKIAKKNYVFVGYRNIPWGERFILWRHDCDFSINRAHTLAKIEYEEGVSATYFVNVHSEFYNVHEKNQYELIRGITQLGHDIGLHLDVGFYNDGIKDEVSLAETVRLEASHLERLFGVRPAAFSFHNPTPFLLRFEEEEYGGLINCYSRCFKSAVGYCSDSNGYWRFRRLYDVLSEARDHCLQVLTHPGWWQDIPMPPRQRVFRCIYGRARSTLRSYDAALKATNRVNHAGLVEHLWFIVDINSSLFELYDYLWNSGHLETLFLELFRLHEHQMKSLREFYQKRSDHVHFNESDLSLLRSVFNDEFDPEKYQYWRSVRDRLIGGVKPSPDFHLESGCMFLCTIIKAVDEWKRANNV